MKQVGASKMNVVRGINGTVAADHEDGAELMLQQFPAEIVEATLLTAADRC